MADRDRNTDTIIGRDADAAHQVDRTPEISGDDLIDQLNQTTSEDAGGNVTGTGAREELDIVFEYEGNDETRH